MADRRVIQWLQMNSITLLRVGLGIVFVWFGALKVFGVSPVEDLIASTYSFLPLNAFMIFLGIWEIIIGIGLIFKLFLRVTLILFVVQMTGTLLAPFLDPQLFFSNGNPLLLTTEGEFVIKNLVLVSAGLVIAGHQIKEYA